MVAKQDLAKANEMSDEYVQLGYAIQNLDSGGQIISMTISGATQPNVTLSTIWMSYPEQMIETMTSMLVNRQHQLHATLAEMGVNVDEPEHPLPEPEPETEGEPESGGEP